LAHECKRIEFSFEHQNSTTYIEVNFDQKTAKKYQIGESIEWPEEFRDEEEPELSDLWTWGDVTAVQEIPTATITSESDEYDSYTIWKEIYELNDSPNYEDEGQESSYYFFK